jgi:hypothetical protein
MVWNGGKRSAGGTDSWERREIPILSFESLQ